MADRGRPLGTKKQGAPQKIINLLDQVLRYNNELSLLDNIQNWVAQTCNINITLLSNKNQEFESLKIIELDDERKAAMVSNLLVVLCSERSATPIVNAGTLNN